MRPLIESGSFSRAPSIGASTVCKFIIENVDEKNPSDYKGNTPLHEISSQWRTKSHEIFKLIFDNASNKNPADSNGLTPLHNAAKLNNLETCKLIAKNIENKNPVDDEGKTPMDYAKERNHDRIIEFFENLEKASNAGLGKMIFLGGNEFLELLSNEQIKAICKSKMAVKRKNDDHDPPRAKKAKMESPPVFELDEPIACVNSGLPLFEFAEPMVCENST